MERRNDRTLASDRGPYANRIPRTSNRSGCFDLKRRSNRTQASIRGSYGNRGCAAREICDDDASGGPVSFCPPSGDRYCFSYPRPPRRWGPCRIGIPHQALRASFPQGKPGYWSSLRPFLSLRFSRPSSPPRGLPSRCGSVRRGSDMPPACHSLPRPCFAAPGGRCQPPSPARRMTDEGLRRSRGYASGGPVSLTREKPGKERGGAPPLHPRCAGR